MRTGRFQRFKHGIHVIVTLIVITYRISASNAICAPLSWQQGDLRRPYPTDIEMRLGFLGKSELNGHNLQHQNSTSSDLQRSAGEIQLYTR